MPSHYCERAIEDALRCGKAILKYISPNDVDLTGGHQCGFLLPKPAWRIYTPDEPKKSVNYTRTIKVLWQDGRVTNSNVKWYGDKSRSEFRMTGFGRDFPFRTYDDVGNMLVLIPESYNSFIAYILYSDEDFDEIQSALGVEIVKTWAAYEFGAASVEDEDECISRLLRQYAGALNEFPSGAVCSAEARKALEQCLNDFKKLSADDVLMKSYDTEHQLFRLIERQVCQREIMRVFKDVDDFLSTASSIMNRRKSRAGRALENHVEYVLKDAGIPHKRQPKIDGEPDI